MFKKLPVKLIVILFCIAFHSLNTQAGVFKPKPGSKVLANSIISAISQEDSVIIEGCQISQPFLVEGSFGRPHTIKSFIDIYNSIFSDSVSLRYCYFANTVRLRDVTFSKKFNLSENFFREEISFVKIIFNEASSFDSSTFNRVATFENNIFNDQTSFSKATFRERVYFTGTTFNYYTEFDKAYFYGSISFLGVDFNGLTSFHKTVFTDIVILEAKQFQNISITWKQLENYLWLPHLDYFRLMKIFEEKRQLNDADEVYLCAKNLERMKQPWYIRYSEYWLFQVPFGYGVKPFNTLCLSICIVFFFAFCFSKPNALKEIEKQFRHEEQQGLFQVVPSNFSKRFYNALYFSIHTFIIGIVSNWYPSDEFLINTRRIKLFKFRTLSMIEGVLGWILLAVFIVILTRKFIR